jgi:hypothetical protein
MGLVLRRDLSRRLTSSEVDNNFLYGKTTLSAVGNTSFILPIDSWILNIAIITGTAEVIAIGTTTSGMDLLTYSSIPSGNYISYTFNKYFSETETTTIYMTGATGLVTYQVLYK